MIGTGLREAAGMNGPQDLGGQMGFGPVAPETDEPYFHADWEKRALGLTISAGAMGHWNIDESRHARESLHPADYYASSYYEIWIKALEVLLERHGFVTADELASGAPLAAGTTAEARAEGRRRAGRAGQRRALQPAGGDAGAVHGRRPRAHEELQPDRPYAAAALCARQDRRRSTRCAKASSSPTATRMAAARTRNGSTPWSSTAAEIWGEGADPTLTVSIDAWESYLEPA